MPGGRQAAETLEVFRLGLGLDMPPLAPLAAGSRAVPAVDAAGPSFGELLVQLEKTLKAEHLADTQVSGHF